MTPWTIRGVGKAIDDAEKEIKKIEDKHAKKAIGDLIKGIKSLTAEIGK